MSPKPVQKPLPIWMGVGHPNAVRRAASMADGWMGSGGSSIAEFGRVGAAAARGAGEGRARPGDVPDLEAHLHGGGREAGGGARANCIAGSPRCTTTRPAPTRRGIHGTPEQVREKLEEVIAMGANHLLLNPVSRHEEQVEALAEVVGF